MDFIGMHYDWFRALHLIFVISWMSGIFYLPRLFVYHTRAAVGGEQDRTFQLMELKLLRIIMNPAMILSWLTGLALGAYRMGAAGLEPWFTVKLVAVLAMTGFHMVLARWRREFAAGANSRSERYYRIANEVPTLLMILIVIMAVIEPF